MFCQANLEKDFVRKDLNANQVKQILRHKRVDSTVKYVQMLNLEDEEFEVPSATTIAEIRYSRLDKVRRIKLSMARASALLQET